jgi:TetR/AcrR family fatty acid metabolism transcriptional regulator
VIIEGQREGVFRPELSPSLILNLIFGTIDLILITWLLENNPSDPLSFFDAFFDMLIFGIRDQKLDLNAKKDKKKQILDAATKIFSQNGYAKTRIQDISRSAEIADATIYKYFSGKEEILFSLPVENTKTLLSIQKEHLNGLRDTDLKLEILLKDYLHFLDSHKDYATIVLFDLRYNKLFYKTEGYKLFKKFSRVFFDIIMEGIKKNHYRAAINPYLATKMLFGVTDHVIISSIEFGRPDRVSNLSDRICAVILSALKNDEAD